MMNFRSFEYLEDKGKVNERAWANLRNISDEICRANNLSVIENPEKNKGKSHYEWDMNRQCLSWKAKLKFAIDEVIKQSDNFEDFLKKCRESGIEVSYTPKTKIIKTTSDRFQNSFYLNALLPSSSLLSHSFQSTPVRLILLFLF